MQVPVQAQVPVQCLREQEQEQGQEVQQQESELANLLRIHFHPD